MSDRIENARISATTLGTEDHGIFTAWLTLDFGGAGQGFGGYALDGKPERTIHSQRPGTAYGMEFIIQVLRVLEVERWEKLPGTYCRVQRTDNAINRIGHVLKDKWFDPRELAEKFRGANGECR